jgi:hypothetical protein
LNAVDFAHAIFAEPVAELLEKEGGEYTHRVRTLLQ